MRITRALALISLISLVPLTWSMGTENDHVLPVVDVVEPAMPVVAEEGKPIRIRWRVLRPPTDPADWEVSVSIGTCVFGDPNTEIYSARLDQARSSVDWIPSREFLERLTCGYLDPLDCNGIPILVELFNAKEGGEGSEELRAMRSACKCVPYDRWLIHVCSVGVIDFADAMERAQEEAGGRW